MKGEDERQRARRILELGSLGCADERELLSIGKLDRFSGKCERLK
jgi:hypothetical protein